MTVILGLTKEAIEEELNENIVEAKIVSGNLILVTRGGVEKNLGQVRGGTGLRGLTGPAGPPGPALIQQDTGWNLIAYQNGWQDSDAAGHPGRYRKINGVVYLQGLVRNPASQTGASAGSVVFTLPAGYRTNKNIQINTMIDGTHGRLMILSDGRVRVESNYTAYTNGPWVTLSTVSFPADA